MLALIVACLLLPAAGRGAEVLSIRTERDGGVFSVETVMLLDAAPQEIMALLTDYDDFARVDRAIVLNHQLREEDGLPVVHTRLCGCVGFLCKRIDKVDRFEQPSPELLIATGDGSGDLESNRMRWELLASEDGRTEMRFDWELDPAFWVPPLIGTYAVERSLGYVVPRFGYNLEYWAAVDAGRDPPHDGPGPPRDRCEDPGPDQH